MPRHDLLQYSATPEPVEVGFTKSAPSLSKPAAAMAAAAAAAAASEFDIGRGAPLVVSEESNSPSSGRGNSVDTTGSVEAIPLAVPAGVGLPRSLHMGQTNGALGAAGTGVLGKRKASDDVDDRNALALAQRHGFAASAGCGPSSSFASAAAAISDLPMPATAIPVPSQSSVAQRSNSSININSKVSRMSTAMAPAPASARPAAREPTAKAGSAQTSARMGAGQPKKVTARKRAADAQAAALDPARASTPAHVYATAPPSASASARKQPPRALPLDFARIRTHAPTPLELPPRSRARLFGLEHCPVFYPTIDEFAHPMAYIERVANETREAGFGICKIVPPKGWQPPFALDTETFRFSTRLQRLNSMEASARANINFLEQLYLFHRQHQSSKVSIPVIGSKPVNLWLLRKEVNALGGIEAMSDRRKWKQVGKAMGYDCKADNTIAGELRTAFNKIVQPFEDYRIRVTASGASGNGPTPGTPGSAGSSGSLLPGSGSSKGKERATTPSNNTDAAVTMEQVYAASNKLNDALNASPAQAHAHVHGTNGPSHATPLANSAGMDLSCNPHWQPGEYCEVCKSGEDDSSILLCDDCDKGYHLRCLDPPLEAVPKGHWICDTCIIDTGRDYGFEEGHEHTFGSFFQRASSFRQKWLAARPPPSSSAPYGKDKLANEWRRELDIEDHLEREFWRLVESPHETVEVEYGADLHTTKGGSAIPTIESHPTEPYARDGWNLNNLPILPGGLLRYVKSDISGMTVPWGYVGMLFSTFAWHKEDHHTYSVNYHHMGGTKTWYGVPGEDDEILEAAMKAAAPELFEQQPDLLWQLVTIFSPGRLKKAGVRVSVCDQRANEFVITLPKAYHAGFNHDFNYNEAVNFCLPDWLSYDLECVRKYREMCKPPVFSHDELLVTVYRQEASINASRWLLPLFDEMVTRELSRRQQAVASIPGLEIVREDLATSDGYHEERSEDYYQCITDKSFCYLSQITLPGLDHVVCVDHWQALPAGQTAILVTRFTEDELLEMLAEVQRRASG